MLPESLGEVELGYGGNDVEDEMVVNLILSVGLQPIEVGKSDEVLQGAPLHQIGLVLVRNNLLLRVVQHLQGKADVELSEFETQQVVEPPLEVGDVVLDVQGFSLILERLQHYA